MPDATPVGMRLATVAFHATPNLPPAVYGPEIRDAIARALDDAGGVREAVEALEMIANANELALECPEGFKGDEVIKFMFDSSVTKAHAALAALTGTVEKTLDGQWQGSTLGRNTGDEC